MRSLTNSEFTESIRTLNVNTYSDMVAVSDEHGHIVEFKTDGSKPKIEDIIIIDDVEYELTEKQKDTLYAMAYNAQESDKSEAFVDEDYTHFSNLIHA